MHARVTERSLVHPLFHGVRLSGDDAGAGVRLSTEAGWNQTLADWHFLLSVGTGFGFANSEGELVASAVALSYPEGIAWVGMVLVTAQARRQRLATLLMQRVLTHCADGRLVAQLDATTAGQTVYSAIGFHGIGNICRWRRGEAQLNASIPEIGSALRPLSAGDLEGVVKWDRPRFGADRGAVLRYLAANRPDMALQATATNHVLLGYCLGRSGRTATQIGPLVAESEATACDLLHAVLQQVQGPVLLDVVVRCGGVERLLHAHGFRPERDFLRMACGVAGAGGRPDSIYATAGPELG
jgi:GNAT superfamily N-acetyltransferase